MGISVFDRALEFVLRHEGGYSNGPGDSGGETKFGISQRAYPEIDIAALTIEEAAVIYKRDYWRALDLDRMPRDLAIVLFDTAVNAGRRRAVRFLQAAINTQPEVSVTVDGLLGPQTKTAVQVLMMPMPPDAPPDMASELLWQRLAHYQRIAAQPQKHRFLRGWIGRVIDLRGYIK